MRRSAPRPHESWMPPHLEGMWMSGKHRPATEEPDDGWASPEPDFEEDSAAWSFGRDEQDGPRSKHGRHRSRRPRPQHKSWDDDQPRPRRRPRA
jgi:hypothetical protein